MNSIFHHKDPEVEAILATTDAETLHKIADLEDETILGVKYKQSKHRQ